LINRLVARADALGDFPDLGRIVPELEVAARLIEEGIPKDRIVLGFQAPMRTLEGFASGQ
jgi:XisI protein